MRATLSGISHRHLSSFAGLPHEDAFICSSCGWVQGDAPHNTCTYCGSEKILSLVNRLRHDFDRIKQQQQRIAELEARLRAAVARNNRTATSVNA